MADVVAMIDEIFFQAKVMETARQVGVEVRTCTTPEALAAEMAKAKPNLVIVDLNAKSNALEAITRAQAGAKDVPLVAFLSHVQVDLAERARAAGCADVMPRSKFARELATLLAGAKSQS